MRWVLWVLVAALAGLNGWQLLRPVSLSEQEITDRFTIQWALSQNTWFKNHWLGIPTWQNPLDVWVTQEIIVETKPQVIVEAGTFHGGSALLWGMILEQVDPAGEIITIDINNQSPRARAHPVGRERVTFLIGSSTSPEIVTKVKEQVAGRRTMVILDSNHSRDHVLAELRAYADLVPIGGYIVVQDSVVNGHPVEWDQGPGPYEAVEDFLAEDDRFVADRGRERLMMTANPMGFLKRVR